MSTKQLCVIAIVLALSACPLQAAVVNSRWIGPDGGEWGNPNNWSPAIVPDNRLGQTFYVMIDARVFTGDELEVTLRENRTIDRLDVYGNVELQRRVRETLEDIILAIEEDLDMTLTVSSPGNGVTNHGAFWSEVIIQGDVVNEAGACLTKGGLDIVGGSLRNAANASIEVEGETETHDGDILNYGAATFSGSGSGLWAARRLENYGLIQVYGGRCGSDEAVTNEKPGIIRGFGAVDSPQLISNAGLIQSLGGFIILRSLPEFGQEPGTNHGFANTGTVTNGPGTTITVIVSVEDSANKGTLMVNAGGSIVFDCNLVNEPNAVIRLLGGTLAAKRITQKAGATFQGFGGITGNVVIQPKGVIKLTGPTNIVGDVTIEEGSMLDITDGTVLVTGLTTCNGGTVRTKGGTIVTQGGMSGGICRREILDPVGP